MADFNNHEIFSDFDITFKRNAKTGDVIKKVNEDDIKQSMRLLLMTRFYDRKWDPQIGSYVPDMLFKQDSFWFRDVIRDQVETLLTKYEPRITVRNVEVTHKTYLDEDIGNVSIAIDYTINALKEDRSFVYTVNRTR